MITIKKNSFLHRFNVNFGIKDEYWWDSQTNGCPYFWGTIASILKFVTKFIAFVCFPILLLSLLGSSAMIDLFGKDILETSWIWTSPLVGLGILSALVLVAILIVAIFTSFAWCVKKVYNMITKDKSGEDSFFIGYAKAKKNKYCPKIQIK